MVVSLGPDDRHLGGRGGALAHPGGGPVVAGGRAAWRGSSLRRPGRPRGGSRRRAAARGHRHRRGPGDPARRLRRRRATAGLDRRHAGVRRRRRPAPRDPGDRRSGARALARRRAAAPAVAPDGARVAFVLERDDALRRRGRAARRRRVAATHVARRLRLGSHVVGRRPHARVARVGPPEHAVGRVAHRRRRASTAPTPRRLLVAGGDDVAVGQPRFAPAGDALAFVSERTVG